MTIIRSMEKVLNKMCQIPFLPFKWNQLKRLYGSVLHWTSNKHTHKRANTWLCFPTSHLYASPSPSIFFHLKQFEYFRVTWHLNIDKTKALTAFASDAVLNPSHVENRYSWMCHGKVRHGSHHNRGSRRCCNWNCNLPSAKARQSQPEHLTDAFIFWSIEL